MIRSVRKLSRISRAFKDSHGRPLRESQEHKAAADAALEASLQNLEQQLSCSSSQVYASLLQKCANARALSHGKRVHSHLVANGYGKNALLGDLIVQMYGKCGSLEDARSAFDGLRRKGSYSWKFMIAAYAQKGHYREVLQLYSEMHVEPDQHTFAHVLGACSSLGDLAEGTAIHSRIVGKGLQPGVVVATALVNMYGKCGELDAARRLFDGIQDRDVVCWNALVTAYAHHGFAREAVELYEKMVAEGVEPNDVTFAGALGACSCLQAFEQGKAIHARIAATKFQPAVFVQNALISMYAKCSRLDLARMVFEKMDKRNVVSWNALIAAYAQHGHYSEALDLYGKMDLETVKPDCITFTTALGACSRLEALQVGKAIHARISLSGVQSGAVLQIALVNMYAKCGEMDAAKMVFDRIQDKNVVAWNVMIVAYAQHGYGKEALDLYNQLESQGLQPDEITVASAVSACSSLGALEEGESIHALAIAKGIESAVPVQNALVNMYAKCGKLEAAQSMFDRIAKKNVISWTGMIGGYAQHGHSKKAIGLYREMNLEGLQPNEITFASILSACSNEVFQQDGIKIHACIACSGYQSCAAVETAIIAMYANCGRVDLASKVFESTSCQSVASWNAMIGAYTQLGYNRDALDLYGRMNSEGVQPNDITFVSALAACSGEEDLESGERIHRSIDVEGLQYGVVVQTALVNMYWKCGSFDTARRIFNGIQNKDVVSWNVMLAAYAQDGEGRACLDLYDKMVSEGVEPDSSTFASVLCACSSLGGLKEGKAIHACIVGSGFESGVVVETALINMYAKCGKLDIARSLFDNALLRNVVSWNTMITGYAMHGYGSKALDLTQEMECGGVKPNEITFMSMLVACSHSGLSSKGRTIFQRISVDYGVAPTVQHYVCMADLLARAGRLEDAEDLIHYMPFQPYDAAWVSLLGGCRVHGDILRGRRVAEHVLKVDPQNTAPYNLLSNLYHQLDVQLFHRREVGMKNFVVEKSMLCDQSSL